MTPKTRHSWRLSRSEAANFLRQLAEALENGTGEVATYGVNLDELVRFKVKMDLGRDEAVHVDFSGKKGEACCTDAVCGTCDACGDYPSLKKRMQVRFKAMRQALAKEAPPSSEDVEAFLLDSERMCSFPDHGDDFYPAYRDVCARLRRAVDSADLPLTTAVLDELMEFKKSCHARLK